jgi:hypothetical protein
VAAVSHRDLAVCLFSVLTAACVAGLGGVLRAQMNGRGSGAGAIAVAAVALLCGIYAALGWAWFLATGVLR